VLEIDLEAEFGKVRTAGIVRRAVFYKNKESLTLEKKSPLTDPPGRQGYKTCIFNKNNDNPNLDS